MVGGYLQLNASVFYGVMYKACDLIGHFVLAVQGLLVHCTICTILYSDFLAN